MHRNWRTVDTEAVIQSIKQAMAPAMRKPAAKPFHQQEATAEMAERGVGRTDDFLSGPVPPHTGSLEALMTAWDQGWDQVKETLAPLRRTSTKASGAGGPQLRVIFEDSDVLVIHKPSGLAVHPGSGNEHHSVVGWLDSEGRGRARGLRTATFAPSPAHRAARSAAAALGLGEPRPCPLGESSECRASK